MKPGFGSPSLNVAGTSVRIGELFTEAVRLRLVSVFRQGWVALVVALLRQEPLPEGHFVPAPWPAVPAWEEATCEPQLALPEAA